MPKPKSRKKKWPKRVLALQDLEHVKTAVLNNLTSASGSAPTTTVTRVARRTPQRAVRIVISR